MKFQLQTHSFPNKVGMNLVMWSFLLITELVLGVPPEKSVWAGLVAKVKRCMHVWEDDAAEVKFISGTNDCVSLEEVCRAPDVYVDPG